MDPTQQDLLEEMRRTGIFRPGTLPPNAGGFPDVSILRGQGALFGVPLGATYTPPQRNPQVPQALLDQANTQTLTQRYAPNLRQHLPPMAADYLAEVLRYPMMPGFRGPAPALGRAPTPPPMPETPPAPLYRATDYLPETPFGWNPPPGEGRGYFPRF